MMEMPYAEISGEQRLNFGQKRDMTTQHVQNNIGHSYRVLEITPPLFSVPSFYHYHV